jgi:N-acetylmuramoyl-L-alanine amidase
MTAFTIVHISVVGWFDIGYNFLVGEDGRVYEGRGWDREGAHTHLWNSVAVAFSVMGNFMTRLPDPVAMSAVQNMITCGIQQGRITPEYKLYGHRDVGATACPGDKLYELINTWAHYDQTHTPVRPV